MSDASSAPDLSRLSIPKTPLRRRSGGGWGRFLPWLVVIVLAAVGWFFFGDRIQALRAPKSEEPDGPPTVRIQAAGVLRAATEGLSANGYVVARRRAALSTVLSGRLVEIRVEEGSRVEKDDIIARIQFDDYEAQLAEAKAALEVTKAQRAQAETEVTAAPCGTPAPPTTPTAAPTWASSPPCPSSRSSPSAT
ncbi:MAG: biotin/lipoyl-binding protein, partial [Planctomycetes bacterium]|nr:biotin/lipoyl-binding protein [Planctomycetota bacterium]